MKDAGYWIEKLALKPHAEGGWYRELWRADLTIPASALPPQYSGERSVCTLIHYLLEAGSRSAWHRVKSAEVWLWHAGGTLELSLGGLGGAPEDALVSGGFYGSYPIGTNPDKGEALYGVVPPDVWQAAGVREGPYVLVSCAVSPGFYWEDFSVPGGGPHILSF
ncbi:MAG: cupin domain-containing protein [Treponema sp.]|jgi:predicted cupin superfamily sugar epimerase|nr:cupin domain-containing protein [Treponema sp.]